MSSQSILVKSADSIHDSSEKTLLKNANNYMLQKRFAIDRKVNTEELAHAMKLMDFLCTENCELLYFINKVITEGAPEDYCLSDACFKDGQTVFYTPCIDTTDYLLKTCTSEELLNDPEFIDSISDKVLEQLGLDDTQYLGWVFVGDTLYTETNPFSVPATVKTKITNNAGTFINVIFPLGGMTWWSNATNSFQFDNVGDTYDVRVQFKVKPTLNNQDFELELNQGGADPVVISKTIVLGTNAGEITNVSETLDFATLDDFVSNGGELFITSDSDLEIYDITFKIERKFRNI